MADTRSIALLQSHQRIPPTHMYYVPDLVELCGLAAAIRDLVDDIWIPVSPSDRSPLATFERFMRRCRPEVVGISAFTCGANSAREYAAIAAGLGARVFLGGFHPSALPEDVLSWPGVEVVVRGEGEATLRELLTKGCANGVAGTSYRSNGDVVHEPDRPVVEDLDSLPLPLRELRPERFGLSGLEYHTDTIYGSRGCRGRCRFCANHLVGKGWRPRSTERILAELATITPSSNGRAKYVKFWDSSFLTDPERVRELCDGILEAGLNRGFRFVAECRVEDVIRATDILPLMQKAGFVRIGCGVESPNRTTHKSLRKGINLNHVDRAAELLRSAGIQFSKFLILGHAGEDEADILSYVDYALQHGTTLQRTTFFVMTPYPGTELAEEYDQRGWIANRNWDLYTNFGAVVAPDDISAEKLQILHCAVAASYGVRRRFAEGRGLTKILERLVEPLLLYAAIGTMQGAKTAAVERGIMQALVHMTCRNERAQGSMSRRYAVRFYLPGCDDVVLAITEVNGTQTLIVQAGEFPIEDAHGRLREIRVSARRLVSLVAALDYASLAHDVTLLGRSPRRFRMRWIPSLARQLTRAALGLGGLVAGHLTAPRRAHTAD